MKKYISILLTMACLALSGAGLTSCATPGGGSVITNVETWLSDPKNQALIQEIAQVAQILISVMGQKQGVTQSQAATVTGRLAMEFPGVPAGALAKIAHNPKAYLNHAERATR